MRTAGFEHLDKRTCSRRTLTARDLWLDVRWSLVIIALAALGACGGSGGSNAANNSGSTSQSQPPPPPATFRLVNGAWQAPPLNVLIDSTSSATNLDYGQAVAGQVAAGSHQIKLDFEVPGQGSQPSGSPPTTVNFATNTRYLLVVRQLSNGELVVDAFPEPSTAVSADSARIQVLNFDQYADATTPLAVYLTVPGADLSTSTPLGPLSLAGYSDFTEVPTGSYEVRIVQAGTLTPVLYDSGTFTLTGGSDHSLVVLPNAFQGISGTQIELASVDAAGQAYWIYQVGTTAGLFLINDAPSDGVAFVNANGVPLIVRGFILGFTNAIGASVTPGENTLVVSGGSPTVTLNANLQEGHEYSLFILGDTQTSALLVEDKARPYASGLMRFVHGAQSAPAVDVYTSTPGPGVTPIFRSLTYFTATAFVQAPAGADAIIVTKAGTTTVLAELQNSFASTPGNAVNTYVLAENSEAPPAYCIFVAGPQPCNP